MKIYGDFNFPLCSFWDYVKFFLKIYVFVEWTQWYEAAVFFNLILGPLKKATFLKLKI